MAGIIRRILVATVSLGALVSAGVGPATAAVIEADHYRFADSEVLRNFCGSDIDFRHEFRGHGYFSAKTRGPNTPLYFADRFHSVDSFINLDTNKSFTVVRNGQFRDHKITVNPDGTLTIVQQFSGIQLVRDDTSHILFKDRGTARFEFVVDYNGTLTNPDDDEFVEDHGEVFRAGKYDTLNRDFCADVLEFTA
ncbi:MAG: hypothetical protein H0V23_04315 [Nocardioidaceae bacterium]|nr:hypothetical protein [Nocardioidaceae bacterium]